MKQECSLQAIQTLGSIFLYIFLNILYFMPYTEKNITENVHNAYQILQYILQNVVNIRKGNEYTMRIDKG